MGRLREYVQGDFLNEGHSDLLNEIRPVLIHLVERLEELGPCATENQRLATFAAAFELINRHEDEIETVERESILKAVYDIGEIVGLDREAELAEQWRGDW